MHSLNLTTSAGIVEKHLRDLFQIIAGDAVRKHVNLKSIICHIEAGGLHAGGCVRSRDIKLVHSVGFNKGGKCFARQGIRLCLDKNVVRDNLQF